jgi:hypothetical protein
MVSLNKTSVSVVSDDYLILIVCTILANLTPIWHLFVFFVLNYFVYLASRQHNSITVKPSQAYKRTSGKQGWT